MKIKQYYCKQCGKEYKKYNTTDKFCSKKCQTIKEKEKKKTEKLKKSVSPKVLYKKNVEMAKEIAKIRDNYTCQRCGSKNNIHASHVINEARDHRLSTYEFNIKALCYNCHLNWWHKNPCEAAKWFDEKFPGRYQLLHELHLLFIKDGKIPPIWHIEENERLKRLLKDLKS